MSVVHLTNPDGTINFRACLARARHEREIAHRVNRRSPDLAFYWNFKNRRDKVRFYMTALVVEIIEEAMADETEH